MSKGTPSIDNPQGRLTNPGQGPSRLARFLARHAQVRPLARIVPSIRSSFAWLGVCRTVYNVSAPCLAFPGEGLCGQLALRHGAELA